MFDLKTLGAKLLFRAININKHPLLISRYATLSLATISLFLNGAWVATTNVLGQIIFPVQAKLLNGKQFTATDTHFINNPSGCGNSIKPFPLSEAPPTTKPDLMSAVRASAKRAAALLTYIQRDYLSFSQAVDSDVSQGNGQARMGASNTLASRLYFTIAEAVVYGV